MIRGLRRAASRAVIGVAVVILFAGCATTGGGVGVPPEASITPEVPPAARAGLMGMLYDEYREYRVSGVAGPTRLTLVIQTGQEAQEISVDLDARRSEHTLFHAVRRARGSAGLFIEHRIGVLYADGTRADGVSDLLSNPSDRVATRSVSPLPVGRFGPTTIIYSTYGGEEADSSAAGLAAQATPEEIRAFAAGFDRVEVLLLVRE